MVLETMRITVNSLPRSVVSLERACERKGGSGDLWGISPAAGRVIPFRAR